MGEIVIIIVNEKLFCRICHENSSPLEAPCACSGTSKFAHRECIQKWCDEKGDTICEICLQIYEPGYTAIPKKPKKMIVVHDDQYESITNVRELLESNRPRREEYQNSETRAIIDEECPSAPDTSAFSCKTSLLFIFTTLLLVRHFLDVLVSDGAARYPFSLLTVLFLRASGIIVPMYIIFRIIIALENSVEQHQNLHDDADNGEGNEGEQFGERDNLDCV